MLAGEDHAKIRQSEIDSLKYEAFGASKNKEGEKYSKEDYENLINFSPLFEINKEENPDLYNTEYRKFIALLTIYYGKFCSNKPLIYYGGTLVEAAKETVDNYNKERGSFLHFFNVCMARRLHKDIATKIVEDKRGGIVISDKKDRAIRNIIALAKSKGLDINDEAALKKIAEILNQDIKTIKELIKMNNNAISISNITVDTEGEEIDLFDLQTSKEKTGNDIVEEEMSFNFITQEVDKVFVKVQDRQKELLSMLLTAEIIRACDLHLAKAEYFLQGKEFFNENLLNYCKSKGKELEKEDISNKFIGKICGDIPEQSISRAYANFKLKIMISMAQKTINGKERVSCEFLCQEMHCGKEKAKEILKIMEKKGLLGSYDEESLTWEVL